MLASSFKLLAVILCTGCCLQANANENRKIQITLLYESLCPGCKEFITAQLYDTYRNIGADYISLELVPYGHVKDIKVNGTVTKSCQHGSRECYGNKVHGCTLQHNSIENSLAFIYCCESSASPAKDAIFEKCAQATNISWTNVKSCLSSGEAERIFKQNGERTDQFHPEYVPYVIFNGVFNETLEFAALDDLTKTVCDLLGNSSHKPNVC